jgi:hypothetical protein
MVAVPTKPYASVADETAAFEALPPNTRYAIGQCRSPYSPTLILKMFHDNNWALAVGEHDLACARDLYDRDYAVHGNAPATLH